MAESLDDRAASSPTRLKFELAVGPEIDIDSWRLTVPGRGACYLLENERGEPVQLATTGNLRDALIRRLSPDAGEGPIRRIDYPSLVRRVRYRPAFSRFEADWVYLENIRRVMPRQYRKLIRRWRAWWVSVDPGAEHPRFTASEVPTTAGATFGPLPTAKHARQVIETLEDLFDLCRYHEVLVRSPHGTACAYKEMGRCPAPCDGSIAMDDYRRQIEQAIDFLNRPEAWAARTDAAMREAASQLQFEAAGRCKRLLDRARTLDGEAYTRLRPLEQFAYVTIQRGGGSAKSGRARLFAVGPGWIEFLGETRRKGLSMQLQWAAQRIESLPRTPVAAWDRSAIERLSLAAWHVMGEARQSGTWLAAQQMTDPAKLEAAVMQFVSPRH